MHTGDNIECCKNGHDSSSQSDRITPTVKAGNQILVLCNREPFYTSVEFLPVINTYVKSAYLYRKSRLR